MAACHVGGRDRRGYFVFGVIGYSRADGGFGTVSDLLFPLLPLHWGFGICLRALWAGDSGDVLRVRFRVVLWFGYRAGAGSIVWGMHG